MRIQSDVLLTLFLLLEICSCLSENKNCNFLPSTTFNPWHCCLLPRVGYVNNLLRLCKPSVLCCCLLGDKHVSLDSSLEDGSSTASWRACAMIFTGFQYVSAFTSRHAYSSISAGITQHRHTWLRCVPVWAVSTVSSRRHLRSAAQCDMTVAPCHGHDWSVMEWTAQFCRLRSSAVELAACCCSRPSTNCSSDAWKLNCLAEHTDCHLSASWWPSP